MKKRLPLCQTYRPDVVSNQIMMNADVLVPNQRHTISNHHVDSIVIIALCVAWHKYQVSVIKLCARDPRTIPSIKWTLCYRRHAHSYRRHPAKLPSSVFFFYNFAVVSRWICRALLYEKQHRKSLFIFEEMYDATIFIRCKLYSVADNCKNTSLSDASIKLGTDTL